MVGMHFPFCEIVPSVALHVHEPAVIVQSASFTSHAELPVGGSITEVHLRFQHCTCSAAISLSHFSLAAVFASLHLFSASCFAAASVGPFPLAEIGPTLHSITPGHVTTTAVRGEVGLHQKLRPERPVSRKVKQARSRPQERQARKAAAGTGP